MIIPNKTNNDFLNVFILVEACDLSYISGNRLAPRSIHDKIQIINIKIIAAAEVSTSFKNPPG